MRRFTITVEKLVHQGLLGQEREEDEDRVTVRCGARYAQPALQRFSSELSSHADRSSAQRGQRHEGVALLRGVSFSIHNGLHNFVLWANF